MEMTKKEEKKSDLEQLFNSLIKRGRVSFRDYDIAEFNQIGNTFVAINYEGKVIGQFRFRQIVSKESGLWQFVCENGYIKEIETDGLEIRNWDNPKHWIVESALCDEDKLEEFLLSNIKIGNED